MGVNAPLWTAADYAGIVEGSGAAKLADSQVAPLVAQARGYYDVDTAEDVKRVLESAFISEPNKVRNRLKLMVKPGEDFMVLPWYRVDRVVTDGPATVSGNLQVRPSTPLPNAAGKPAKYEMLASSGSVIDLNPGVPPKWLEETTRFLITEGVLKADAALSAQLLAAGNDIDALACAADTAAARATLAKLLGAIPKTKRVPVLAIVGVGNWHQNPEWNTLNFRDRDVLVAFDGDLHQNPNVWSQADRLWRLVGAKGGVPKLVNLGSMDVENQKLTAGVDAGMKVGVDDYLSRIGSFADLLALVEDVLPERPTRVNDPIVGDVRVTASGTSVEEYEKFEGSYGTSLRWNEIVPIGGRIVEVSSLRLLHDAAVRSGQTTRANTTESARGDMLIELSWEDAVTGEVVTRGVTGPRTILETAPVDWTRKGANVHADIMRHPAWPPRAAAGEKFLRAIKAHRVEEQSINNGWDTMGWVPTGSGNPVFLVGEQSLGASHEDEIENRPGVTEEIMPKAYSYGVRDPYWELTEGTGGIDAWKAEIRNAFGVVNRLFITDSFAKRDVIAIALLAAALRPSVPGQSSLNIYLSGAPNSGKSYIASFCMGFFQRSPGTWHVKNLPGTASDTAFGRELSIARTPIFVADDLSSNVSRAEAERQESGIEATIRAVHNGAGKRRGTADGEQRAVSIPRAVTIYTVENKTTNPSLLQRLISIHLLTDSLVSDRAKEVERIMRYDASSPLSTLTSAMIRLWANVDLNETILAGFDRGEGSTGPIASWEDKRALVDQALDSNERFVQDRLQEWHNIPENSSSRRAELVSEMFMTLDALAALALWAGVPIDDPAVQAILGVANDKSSVRGQLITLAAQDMHDLKDRGVVATLLEAIRLLLESGKAHLENPSLNGAHPIPMTAGDSGRVAMLNRAAGWVRDTRNDTWIPQRASVPIGFLGMPAGGEGLDDLVAHISPRVAFDLAQRHQPDLVRPGQKSADAWSQVWDAEGGSLISPSHRSRPASGTTKTTLAEPEATEAATQLGMRGVPVRFAAILGGGDDELD